MNIFKRTSSISFDVRPVDPSISRTTPDYLPRALAHARKELAEFEAKRAYDRARETERQEADRRWVPDYLRRKRKPRKPRKPDTRNVVPIRAHR
jgi:hypothetical protein